MGSQPVLAGLVAPGEAVWLNTPEQVASFYDRAKASGQLSYNLASLLRQQNDILSHTDPALGVKYRLVPEGLEILDPTNPATNIHAETYSSGIPRIRYNFGFDVPRTRAHERFHATDRREGLSRDEIEDPAYAVGDAAGQAHAMLQASRETLDLLRDPSLNRLYDDATSRENAMRKVVKDLQAPVDLRARYDSALSQREALLDRGVRR